MCLILSASLPGRTTFSHFTAVFPFLRSRVSRVIRAQKNAGSTARVQTVKKASQSSLRQQRKRFKLFSTAAHPRVASLAPSGQFTFCTWAKTLLRLQVWNLFAYGEQIMRAADCKKLAEKPEGVFRQAQRGQHCPRQFCLSAYSLHKRSLCHGPASGLRRKGLPVCQLHGKHQAQLAFLPHFRNAEGNV